MVGGTPGLPLQEVDRARRYLVIRALRVRTQTHLDLLGDRRDPFDPPRGALCGRFLSVARDKAGEGYDAPVRRHADVGGIDAGLELELVEDVLLKLQITGHGEPPFASKVWRLPHITQTCLDPNQSPPHRRHRPRQAVCRSLSFLTLEKAASPRAGTERTCRT